MNGEAYIDAGAGELVIVGQPVSADELAALPHVQPGDTAIRIPVDAVRHALIWYDTGASAFPLPGQPETSAPRGKPL